MLRPRDLVGNEYVVQATTDRGPFERRVIAFDPDDARAQILEYCRMEELVPVLLVVR